MTTSPRPTLLLACSLVACSPGTGSTPDPTSSSSSMSGPDTIATSGLPTSSTSVAASTAEPTSTALSGTGASDEGNGFVPDPDSDGKGSDCDLAAQDCPRGQKCNPSGVECQSIFCGPSLCIPLVPDAKPPGSPCSVLGDLLDGTDDCELGSVCLFPDDLGNGQCHAMCRIDSDPKHAISCSPAGTMCNPPACQDCNWGYCDQPCDPRELDACAADEVCIGYTEALFCQLDASGDDGQAGDPCEFLNACDPGLRCADAASIPGCVGSSGCCAPFCSTDQANTCPNKAQGEVCVPWFVDEQPPPELANLGVCALPP